MMLIGYARTSTLEQNAGLDAQLEELAKAGCNRVFQEQVSSVTNREELDAAIDYLQEGDTLVVTRLDRLARSTRHLGELVDVLKAKDVALHILNLDIDTSSPTGKMIVDLLGSHHTVFADDASPKIRIGENS